MYYEAVFRELEVAGVRYLVAGGIAVVLHGVVRLTADLDIIVDFDDQNLERFIGVLGKLGYKPKVPVKAIEFADPAKREEWISKKGMKVFSFYHPAKGLELIDVFVKEIIPFSEMYPKRKVVTASGIDIPVVSILHLKKLKRIAGRVQDIADIKSLENLQAVRRERK